MPDNLRVTAPIPKSENITKPQAIREPTQAPSVQQPPKIVPHAPKQEQGGLKDSLDLLLSRDSVYAKFIEQFKQTPELFQTMPQLIYNVMENAKSQANNKAAQAIFQMLYKNINMNEQDMLQNLLFQQNHNSKFNGVLFTTLRDLTNQIQDNRLNLHLANFLKAYNGYFSLGGTMQSILKNLNDIRTQIIPPYSSKLLELANKLATNQSANANMAEFNLSVLTEEIIPFLGGYVAQTNDFGTARNHMALLLHNVSRLNFSSKEELIDTFKSLFSYCKYNLNFPEPKLNALKAMFAETITPNNQANQNGFYDSLISIFSQGTNHKAGLNQNLLTDAWNALLLDNSVHMPYTHIFLPVIFAGRFMFSEMWIEKQDIYDNEPSKNQVESSKHIFLKFFIEDLGSFEANLELIDKDLNLKLNYPPALHPKNNEINAALSAIFAQNGFKAENIILTAGQPIPVKEQILKKVQERKFSIDVTI